MGRTIWILVLISILILSFAACTTAVSGIGMIDDFINKENKQEPVQDPDEIDSGDVGTPEDPVEPYYPDEPGEEDGIEETEEPAEVPGEAGVPDEEVGGETTQEEPEELYEDPEVLATFHPQLPDALIQNLKYDKYPISHHYLLVTTDALNVRALPSSKASVIHRLSHFEKVKLLEEVRGEYLEKYGTDRWYRIEWEDEGGTQTGYVFSSLAEHRYFQFDKMLASAKKLQEEINSHKTAYISNYKNKNGKAPLYKGATKDKYGGRRDQSAPAYVDPDDKSEFRYIQDGTLVSILDEKDGYIKIRTLNFEGEYWVPKKYVSLTNSIKELTKVIVVDRKNQNQATFEYIDGRWNLISYVLATTGVRGKYSLETELGYYMAIETRPKFLYLDDETKAIAGYAPYAIRFNGGAYIHGVPVEYEIVDGKRVDPGEQEYLSTIGTTPRSHKCVRNYTSHAKFLYDWVEIGKSAVIVIE